MVRERRPRHALMTLMVDPLLFTACEHRNSTNKSDRYIHSTGKAGYDGHRQVVAGITAVSTVRDRVGGEGRRE